MEDFQYKTRCERLGEYLLVHNGTVREAARFFGIGKSTVHKDVTKHLKNENPQLFSSVAAVLEKNKSERHLRGGEATRRKYLEEKRKNQN